MGDNCEHGNDVRYGCKHCDDAGTEPPLARGRMTDLPDAVVEAAAEALYRHTFKDMRGWNYADPPENWLQQARAALAAASGPWAEQLDAAKAEPTSDCTCGHPRWDHFRSTGQCAESGCGCFPFTPVTVPSPLQRQLDAALARNAELQEQRDAEQEMHAQDCAENTHLRAELDNLRETLAQKIEAAVLPIDHTKTVTVVDVQRQCAAIVRGSDDEEKP